MVEVHAYIEVTDAARGIAFYCDGLGLTVKRRFGPRWIELAGANLPVFLLADRPPVADLGTTEVSRSYARHWTPVHLDFIVDGLDATVARLIALGARSIATSRCRNMAASPTWPTRSATAST